MKFGKIYYYRNKEEARKLIGKKVIASDIFYRLENPTEKHPKVGIFEGFTNKEEFPFNVALSLSIEDLNAYQFIREIEEDEPKLMTNRQLAEWLAKGNGEIMLAGGEPKNRICHTVNEYFMQNENKPIFERYRIRPWGSDEWVVPTLEIYERDCKGIRTIE